jgi:hypothetical protein
MAQGQMEGPDLPTALPGLPGLGGASSLGQAGLGLEGIGLVGQGVAAYGQYQAQEGISQSSQNIAALQQQQNQINWTGAQLSARRSQMEVIRNEQRARSLALSNSANQGAQFGSGLSGGYGQIYGQTGNNLLGINQNLSLGAQSYAVNQSISGQEQNIAKYQGQAAMWQGVSSLSGGATSAGSGAVSASTGGQAGAFASLFS